MSKHFIEKPKRPACLQLQNYSLMLVTFLILLFFDPIFLIIFITAMTIFCIYDIHQFKNMPEAILYAREGVLYYYHKRVLEKMPYEDIEEVKVTLDKKNNTYIEINYNYNEIKRQHLIKNENATDIVNEINKLIKKRERKEILKNQNKK